MHLKSEKPKSTRINRDERRLQTIAALRESAMREFALCGVSGTSAERIAEAAGYSRGAFYANFENKQALLLDLVHERVNQEQQAWVELTNSQLDMEALLTILEERAVRFDSAGLWSMISAETYLYALRDTEFAESYRVHHDTVRQNFVVILEQIFQRAGKKPPLPLDEVCDAMLTLNRTLRLPPAHAATATPQPFSSKLLITVVRGLLAIGSPLP